MRRYIAHVRETKDMWLPSLCRLKFFVCICCTQVRFQISTWATWNTMFFPLYSSTLCGRCLHANPH